MTMLESEMAEAVDALGNRFVDLFNSGDIQRLVDVVYTTDVVVLPSNYPMVRGREAARALLQGMRESGFEHLSVQTMQIRCSGDLAYRIGTYRLEGRGSDSGKFLEVVRRQSDGTWKCVADMFSSDLPLNQQP